MQWVPGPRRPRRKTAGIRDWGRVWPPTLKVVSTRAAPSSQPGSTSFAPTTQRQPNRQTPALQRRHTTTRQAQPASTSRRVPGAEVRSACLLPEWFRLGPLVPRGPAQPASPRPPNANATAQAHDHKASATSFRDHGFDSGRSFLAARLNQLWRARLPRHIRADSTAFPEKRRKNRFLVRLSVISLCKPPCGTHP